MKAGIKLCTSLFSNTPSLFWSISSSKCMCIVLDSWVPSPLLQLKRCFLWGRKWTMFCGWQSWNSIPVFDANLMRCTPRTRQRHFTDLWCVRTSGWLMTLFWLWWRTLRFVMSLWRSFQLCGTPSHFSFRVPAFVDGEFPYRWMGRDRHAFPGPLVLRTWLLWIFSSRGL